MQAASVRSTDAVKRVGARRSSSIYPKHITDNLEDLIESRHVTITDGDAAKDEVLVGLPEEAKDFTALRHLKTEGAIMVDEDNNNKLTKDSSLLMKKLKDK